MRISPFMRKKVKRKSSALLLFNHSLSFDSFRVRNKSFNNERKYFFKQKL